MAAPAVARSRTVGQPTGDVDRVALEVARLVRELRPDLPPPIADSLAVEALDSAADAVLDIAWAHQRARAWPVAVAAAQAWRYVPYAARRARQLAAARPRPGDYPGGPVAWNTRRPETEAA